VRRTVDVRPVPLHVFVPAAPRAEEDAMRVIVAIIGRTNRNKLIVEGDDFEP
jgi:hypothetical protein